MENDIWDEIQQAQTACSFQIPFSTVRQLLFLFFSLPFIPEYVILTPLMENIIVYTDGGCAGNPGAGGWGAVIIADGKVRQLSGGEKFTTNNRRELTAASAVLSLIASDMALKTRHVIVNIDSQYVKNGITTWIKSWKAKGWLTADKKPVKNQDLWQKLDEVSANLDVNWNWVKGHAGIEYNELCDSLCKMEMAKFR